MTRQEYLRWIEKVSSGRKGAGMRKFLRLPKMMENYAGGGSSQAFEASLHSGDAGEPTLKLLHLHAYPAGASVRIGRERESRKAGVFRGIFRYLNGAGGCRFDLPRLTAALARLERLGALPLCNKLGAEFDPDSGAFKKLSHYFLFGPSELKEFSGRVGLAFTSRLATLAASPLDCFGMDYFPGGEVQFKVYNRHPVGHPQASGRGGSAMHRALSASFKICPWVGTLSRVRMDGTALAGRKYFFRLIEPVGRAEVLPLAALKRHRPFLTRVETLLEGRKIHYLAFDSGFLEVYVR